jgi:hypothetical protein
MIMNQIDILREKGVSLNRPYYLLTYCRAVLDFSKDTESKARIRTMLGEVLKMGLREQERKEAELYLASYFTSPP